MAASHELVAYYSANKGAELEKLNRQLPEGVEAIARFQQYVAHLRKNPKLERCSVDSHAVALLDCVSLDLWPGPHGHIYVIPFKTTATAIPGYKGLVRLMKRGGVVTKVSAHVVYDQEPFEFEAGSVDRVAHTPLSPDKRGEPDAVYAVAHYRHGPPQPVMLWWSEVMAIKAKAPGARKQDNPWNGAPHEVAEMGKKTAIRRLTKLVGEDDPKLAHAVALMDRADGYGETVEMSTQAPVIADGAALLEHARSYAVEEEATTIEVEVT